jgi:hypothetical protein
VQIEGSDPGVSFRSVVDREHGTTATVMSNVTDGAWAVSRRTTELLAGRSSVSRAWR